MYFGDCQVGWLSGQFRYKQEWLDWEGAFPVSAYPEYGPNLSMPVGEQSDFQKVEMSDWRAVSEVTDADWSMVKQAVEKVNDTIGAAFDAARLEVGADNKQLELITKHLKSKRRG